MRPKRAMAIGARLLAVTTGSTSCEQLAQARADWVVDSLEDHSVGEILQ